MEEQLSSPKEVIQALKNDLIYSRHLTIAKAAEAMQKDPRSLYNIMKGTHRIGPQMAQRLHDVFGYSIPFLTEGKGSLNESPESRLGRLTIKPNSSEPIHPYLEYSFSELSTGEEQRLNGMKKSVEEAFFMLRNHFDTEDDVIITFAPLIRSTKPEDFGITLHTQRARDLFQSYAFWAGMIQHLIDPGRSKEVIWPQIEE